MPTVALPCPPMRMGRKPATTQAPRINHAVRPSQALRHRACLPASCHPLMTAPETVSTISGTNNPRKSHLTPLTLPGSTRPEYHHGSQPDHSGFLFDRSVVHMIQPAARGDPIQHRCRPALVANRSQCCEHCGYPVSPLSPPVSMFPYIKRGAALLIRGKGQCVATHEVFIGSE